jgi:hypothetical protein
MIEMFAIPQTQDPHVESILCNDLSHQIGRHSKPVKDKRVHESQNAFRMQFGEDPA